MADHPKNPRVMALGDAQGDGEGSPKRHHGGSHHNYMSYKINKLQEQFAGDSSAMKESDLFRGVCIFVNGLTVPPHAELKRLMAVHGGRFENYFSRPPVTHIVCANLPDAKVKHLEHARSPAPIVRPEWVVESIAAGTLLPLHPFMLQQLRGGPGQRSIAEFGGAANAPRPQQQQQQQQQFPVQPHSGSTDRPNNPATTTTAPSAHYQQQQQIAPYDPAELTAAQEVAARMRAECDNLKGPPRSSKNDPNFMEKFYQASRLHFIGSWKKRLEALMASDAGAVGPAPRLHALGGARTVVHLDMDCFFASVAEAGHPEFRGKPIAVCHSNSARGSGEVSSANYEARRYGVKASMFISKAKELCPALIVVPYEFEKYENVSEQYTSAVSPISCDEAFLDITGLGDAAAIVTAIRHDIFTTTGCTASAGIAPNMLLARIATRRAKPDGQMALSAAAALPFLSELAASELPGVGWATGKKLEQIGIRTVADVQRAPKRKLEAELGPKAGALLWDFAHGRDARRVSAPSPRKSVGAEVNWGVRFERADDPDTFLGNLAVEVSERLHVAKVRCRTVTLKIKRKVEGWTEPIKFLGHGECFNLSRSVTLNVATASADTIKAEAAALLRALRVPHTEILGMGLTATRLTPSGGSAGGGGLNAGPAVLAKQPSTALPPNSAVEDASQAQGGAARAAAEGFDGAGGGTGAAEEEDGAEDAEAGVASFQSPSRRRESLGGRGTKRRKSPGKQVSLLELMPPPPPRSGAAAGYNNADDEEEGSSALRAAQAREAAGRFEGMSLTQIDAAELAQLPWEVQRELVAKLPRTRREMSASRAVAAAGAVPQRAEAPAETFFSSDDVELPGKYLEEEAGEERLVAGPQDRATTLVTATLSPPIEALPALSQIDRSVMQALPLAIRRELEAAYRMPRPSGAGGSSSSAGAAAGGGGAGTNLRKAGSNKSSPNRGLRPLSRKRDAGLRRIDAFVVEKEPSVGGVGNGRGGKAGLPRRHGHRGLTLQDIDPAVLHELPPEMQEEVLRQLQPMQLRCEARSLRRGVEEAAVAAAAAGTGAAAGTYLDILRGEHSDMRCSDEAVEDEACVSASQLGDRFLSVAAFLSSTAGVGAGAAAVDALLREISAAVAEIEQARAAAGGDSWPSSENEEERPVGGESRLPATQPIVASMEVEIEETEEELLRKCGLAVKATEQGLLLAGKTLVGRDLEGLRRLLRRVQALGRQFPCFTGCADALVGKLQQLVRRRYGHPLTLR